MTTYQSLKNIMKKSDEGKKNRYQEEKYFGSFVNHLITLQNLAKNEFIINAHFV